nr:MAG TPA: hypothetical protein [Caudoviricetes sp.]
MDNSRAFTGSKRHLLHYPGEVGPVNMTDNEI